MIDQNKENEKLIVIAEKLISLRKKVGLNSLLVPVNFEEEREKFFNSPHYEPQFTYKTKEIPENIEDEIAQLKIDIVHLQIHPQLNLHLQNYIIDLEMLLGALRSIGTETFTDYACDLFSEELEDATREHFLDSEFKFENEEKGELHDAYQIKKAFEKELEFYNLKNYSIQIVANGPIIVAGPSRIILGEDIRRYSNNVRRLIIHEVESHAIQEYNIENALSPFLSLIPYAKMRLWSEGLAVFNEVHTNTITRSSYLNYTKRFEAVKMMNNSFREIFDYLNESLHEKEAYKIAFRVKRGLSDTSRPGGFPKDIAYAMGYLKVKRYVEKGNSRSFLYRIPEPEFGSLLKSLNLLPEDPIVLPKFIG